MPLKKIRITRENLVDDDNGLSLIAKTYGENDTMSAFCPLDYVANGRGSLCRFAIPRMALVVCAVGPYAL